MAPERHCAAGNSRFPKRLLDARELLTIALDEAFGPEAIDQELDAGLGALDAIGILVVQRDHRLHGDEQVVLLDEGLDCDRFVRLVPEATAGDDLEPKALHAISISALDGNDAQVVDHRLRAIRLAAGEADLELARQLLVERVAQEVPNRGLQVMIDVGVLLRANAGKRAGRHVADGVAAGFPCGQAGARPDRASHSGVFSSGT